MLKKTLLTATLAMLIMVASPALAAVEFSTGFESDTASTAAHLDTSGDYDPAGFGIAEFGTTGGYVDNPYLIQVTSYGTPGPYAGSKYCRVNSWTSTWARLHDTSLAGKFGSQYMFTQFYLPSESPDPLEMQITTATTQWFSIRIGDPDDTADNLSIAYKTGLQANAWIDTGYDAIYDEWRQLGIHWRTAPSDANENDGELDLYYGGVKIVDSGNHATWTNSTMNITRQTGGGLYHYGSPGGYPFYVDDHVTGMLLEGEDLPIDRLMGDADRNGVVSADDFAAVQSNFGNIGAGILGDADYNGVVSADDFAAVQANFGNHAPEPATIGLLAMGLIAVFYRRSK